MDTQPSPEADVKLSVQDRELVDAKNKGLLVDIGDRIQASQSNPSPTSVLDMPQQPEMKELDQWDAARNDIDGDDFGLEDSDDDLL